MERDEQHTIEQWVEALGKGELPDGRKIHPTNVHRLRKNEGYALEYEVTDPIFKDDFSIRFSYAGDEPPTKSDPIYRLTFMSDLAGPFFPDNTLDTHVRTCWYTFSSQAVPCVLLHIVYHQNPGENEFIPVRGQVVLWEDK